MNHQLGKSKRKMARSRFKTMNPTQTSVAKECTYQNMQHGRSSTAQFDSVELRETRNSTLGTSHHHQGVDRHLCPCRHLSKVSVKYDSL